MTWRWLICSSCVLLSISARSSGDIQGHFTLRDSREASVRKDLDFSGVVVSLQQLDGGDIPHGSLPHARMLQKNKTFIPHILAVPTGTSVDFPNLDPIFHNAFSRYDGQIFDVALYPPGTSRAVRFTRPGIVRVFCHIHPSMSAIIVVLDTPYFAITDKQGNFAFNAPPGRYILHVFHERATPLTLAALTRPVTIGDDPVELPDMVISEAGYLPPLHNNKYNRPYPPESDDHSLYPGVRK
jgi:hypothetical protein